MWTLLNRRQGSVFVYCKQKYGILGKTYIKYIYICIYYSHAQIYILLDYNSSYMFRSNYGAILSLTFEKVECKLIMLSVREISFCNTRSRKLKTLSIVHSTCSIYGISYDNRRSRKLKELSSVHSTCSIYEISYFNRRSRKLKELSILHSNCSIYEISYFNRRSRKLKELSIVHSTCSIYEISYFNRRSRKLKALSIVHSTCSKISLKMDPQLGRNL